MISRNLFILLISFFIFHSCTEKIQVNQIDNIVEDSLYWPENWQVLGPLYIDSMNSVEVVDYDFFYSFGFCEDSLDYDDFLKCGSLIRKSDTVVIFSPLKLQKQGLLIDEIFPIDSFPGSVYLGSIWETTEAQEIILSFTSYQTGKLWLNGDLIYCSDWKSTRTRYREEFVRIKLKKGNNFMLFKISKEKDSKDISPLRWRFDCSYSTTEKGKSVFTKVYKNTFLRRNLVDKGGQLEFYSGIYNGDPWDIIISGITDTICFSGQAHAIDSFHRIDMPDSLSEGLYRCYFIVKNDTLSETFFYGDIDSFFAGLCDKYNRMRSDLISDQKINVDAMITRLQHVLGKRRTHSYPSQAKFWDKSRVDLLDLDRVLQELEKSADPFRLGLGGFRAYKRNEADSLHYYTLYVPQRNKSQKVPVVIHLVPESKDYRSSWLVHWQNNGFWDYYRDLAERNQVAYIYTNCGGLLDPENCRDHFRAILNSLKGQDWVDMSRIFLVGNCGSTKLALQLLDCFGDYVAGAGFINPELSSMDYSQMNYSNNQKANHQLYVCCSFYDEKIPIQTCIHFYNTLRTINVNAKLEVSYDATHNVAPPDYINKMYQFFVK